MVRVGGDEKNDQNIFYKTIFEVVQTRESKKLHTPHSA